MCQSPISNGYAYRFYTSSTSPNTPFYLYKVPANAVEAPIFSPAEGAVAADGSFTSPFLLTITCATEGAQIYYTLDGTDPSSSESRLLYQSPLSISVTTTLRAIATNGTDNSKEVKVTYLQIKGYAESIAEFIAMAPTSAFELRLTQAQEAVIIGITSVPQHVYLQDKSGKGIILHMQDLNLPENVGLGYQIVGSVFGTLGEYEGKPRIENIQFSEDISFLAGARPKPIVVEEITDTTYARYPLVLVSIRDITFNQEGEICKAGNTYTCRDAFGVMSGKNVPESTTRCHVTSILGTYGNLTYQIMPVVEADIDTQGALAALPTISPIGGETSETAVQTERVSIMPASNTTVWIDNVRHAYEFNVPITQSPHALTLTAKRDFYQDNSVTLWYSSSQPSTPTYFSSMDFPEEKPRKTIINNQLVIIHHTGIYNAQGVRMR